MLALAIIGMLVLFAVACYLLFCGVGSAFASYGFTGRVDPACWFILLLGGFVMWLAFYLSPFSISFKY